MTIIQNQDDDQGQVFLKKKLKLQKKSFLKKITGLPVPSSLLFVSPLTMLYALRSRFTLVHSLLIICHSEVQQLELFTTSLEFVRKENAGSTKT